jgi:hypothetical protein
MARPKIDFKKVLLEKGEKIGIITAGVIMVLLVVWAGIEIAASKSKDTLAGDLDKKVVDIRNQMKGNSGDPTPLDPTLLKKIDYPTLASHETEYFIALQLDNTKRGSPQILGPTEFQVDLVRAPVLVYIFSPEMDKIYVVKEVAKNKNLSSKSLEAKVKGKKKPASDPAPGGPGMGGPGGGMGPGGPGGGMGGPGGGMGPGGPGGGMGMPGGRGGMGGPGGSYFNQTANAVDYALIPIPIKDFNDKYKAAEQIKPVRMVVVQMSFPLRAEMEEYRKALRYDKLTDLIAKPDDLPTFKGFEVQRRIRSLDGSKILSTGENDGWENYDWLDAYKPLNIERIAEDEKEDERLVKYHIIPPDDQHLALPLPVLAGDRKYPKLELKTIDNAVAELEKSGGSQLGLASNDKFKGDQDPFARSGSGQTASGKATGNQDSSAETVKPSDALEAILCRFVDVKIQQGLSYEYRVRMVAANPNHGKDALVGRPDYAHADVLKGEWTPVTFKQDNKTMNWISVTPESDAFAFHADARSVRGDHIRMEVQEWKSEVRTDPSTKNADRVGDWVMEDIDVGRGQYIFGTKEVRLPVWDPAKQKYHFKDLAARVKVGAVYGKKGLVPVEFNSGSLLVDFEGGKETKNVKGKTVQDDAGLEVLIMTWDGRLQVRNDRADYFDTARVTRHDGWKSWVDKVDETEKQPAKTGTDGFNKPGGDKR